MVANYIKVLRNAERNNSTFELSYVESVYLVPSKVVGSYFLGRLSLYWINKLFDSHFFQCWWERNSCKHTMCFLVRSVLARNYLEQNEKSASSFALLPVLFHKSVITAPLSLALHTLRRFMFCKCDKQCRNRVVDSQWIMSESFCWVHDFEELIYKAQLVQISFTSKI